MRLILGDCLEEMRQLPDASVDAVICDPPYSSGGFTRGDRTGDPAQKYGAKGASFGGDNRDQRSYLLWSRMWLSEAQRVMKQVAPICVFSDWRQLPLMTDALQIAGFVWRGIVVWDKTPSCRPFKGRFSAQCEYVIWGSNGPMPLDRGVGCLPGCFSVGVRQADRFHLTGKPAELIREIVRITREGDTILDPFMGSGTTGVAALMEGRDFIGIEQQTDYFEIARKRLEEADWRELKAAA